MFVTGLSRRAEGGTPVEASAAGLADTAEAAESSASNSIYLELRKARLRIDGHVDPPLARDLEAILGSVARYGIEPDYTGFCVATCLQLCR